MYDCPSALLLLLFSFCREWVAHLSLQHPPFPPIFTYNPIYMHAYTVIEWPHLIDHVRVKKEKQGEWGCRPLLLDGLMVKSIQPESTVEGLKFSHERLDCSRRRNNSLFPGGLELWLRFSFTIKLIVRDIRGHEGQGCRARMGAQWVQNRSYGAFKNLRNNPRISLPLLMM